MIRAGLFVNGCFSISGLFVIIASLLFPRRGALPCIPTFVRFKMDGDMRRWQGSVPNDRTESDIRNRTVRKTKGKIKNKDRPVSQRNAAKRQKLISENIRILAEKKLANDAAA